MAQQPRGRPPSQAPPPAGRGRNALTALGGGVLVLAVAGGAWALFGRDENKTTDAISPTTSTSSTKAPVLGPGVPGTKPAVSATSTKPVAGPNKATATPAPTKAPVVKPTAAVVATKAPTPIGPVATTAPPKPPVAKPPVSAPVAKPPVTAPQQGGTVAKKDYTFKVARGDTLWSFTQRVLAATGRSTSNANTAAHVTRFFQNNAGVIGSNPDLILPGQMIVWPTGL